MSKLRVNTIVNRVSDDKVSFPFGIGVTNGIICSGVVTATSFVGSGQSLTDVTGIFDIYDDEGNAAFLGVSSIRVGSGLSATEATPDVIKFDMGGDIEGALNFGTSPGEVGVTTIGSGGRIKSQKQNNVISTASTDLSTPERVQEILDTGFSGAIRYDLTDENLYVHSEETLKQIAYTNHTGIFTATTFDGQFKGNGISTFTDLHVDRNFQVSGISTFNDIIAGGDVTFTNGRFTAGLATALEFRADGFFANSGVSTFIDVGARNLNVGVLTATSINADIVGNVDNTDINTEHLTVTGTFNSTGISTVTYLESTNLNVTGIATVSTLDALANGLYGTPNVIVGHGTAHSWKPSSDNQYDLGDSNNRWANVYTADMHFSNVGTGGNDIDGTEGNWTLQEGSEEIYMINNITGKRYKINLTEV